MFIAGYLYYLIDFFALFLKVLVADYLLGYFAFENNNNFPARP